MMTKPWNKHRKDITRLYITEGRTLQDVRRIMKTEFGFDASIRSYRQHFDMWNVGKYNCKKRIQRHMYSASNILPSPPETPSVMPIMVATERTPSVSSASSSQETQATSPMSEMATTPRRHFDNCSSAFYGASSYSPIFGGGSAPLAAPATPSGVPIRPRQPTRCVSADGQETTIWDQDTIQSVLPGHHEPLRLDVVYSMDFDKLIPAKCPWEWNPPRTTAIALNESAPDYWRYNEAAPHSPPSPPSEYDREQSWQANIATRTSRPVYHAIAEESPVRIKNEDDEEQSG